MSAHPASAPEAFVTVGDVLREARALGVARLDAQLLLAHFTGWSRAALLARQDEQLAPALREPLRQALRRRADAVPLAYLVGRREFHGLPLTVGPAVLDPRPDTEVLVDWALECLLALPRADGASPRTTAPWKVVDLGTGSGAVALALAARVAATDTSPATVTATDVSPAALEVATDNARRLGLDVTFRQGCWWSAVDGSTFDLAISNPPYIRDEDPHLEALRHEPRLALVAGADGLDALRAIVTGAPLHLNSGAWLLMEHGHDQADDVAALLRQAGFEAVQHRADLAGHRRCTGGRWPGSR